MDSSTGRRDLWVTTGTICPTGMVEVTDANGAGRPDRVARPRCTWPVRSAIALAVSGALALLGSSDAAACPGSVGAEGGSGGGSVDVGGESGDCPPSGPGGGGGGGTPGHGPPAPPVAREPIWAVHPDSGEPCIELVPRPDVDLGTAGAAQWEQRLPQMLADRRLAEVAERYCPGADAPPVADPSAAARAFVRSIALPRPEPRIPPGFAVTGMPAFLVIDGQDDLAVSEPIPGFGRLEVALEPVGFRVDWGDGQVEHVVDGRTGVPWELRHSAAPISHVYVDRAPDTVVHVDASWVARWRLGGFSGIVGGLGVDAELPLPVEEYRAARLAP